MTESNLSRFNNLKDIGENYAVCKGNGCFSSFNYMERCLTFRRLFFSYYNNCRKFYQYSNKPEIKKNKAR